MLEKPDIPDEKIIACLKSDYGLPVIQLTFLPIGADLNTAVYRGISDSGRLYFIKLRWAFFNEIAVTLPRFLNDHGILQVMAAIPNKTGQLWADLTPYSLILYDFIEGQDGYAVNMSGRQWLEFGQLLKKIHSMHLPPALRGAIPQETYSPQWRERLAAFLERIKLIDPSDPLIVETALFLNERRAEILDVIHRTESLAQNLKTCPLESIMCHADIHAGNILIASNGTIYLVDWDAPILAPKERDLMSIGGGLFGGWRSPEEEQTLFYQGYGREQLDRTALAYYRYERIIQDLEVECEQIFSVTGNGQDREQAFHFMKSNFQPGNVLEIARWSDRAAG